MTLVRCRPQTKGRLFDRLCRGRSNYEISPIVTPPLFELVSSPHDYREDHASEHDQ